ncbi:MAG: hypothetical protein CMA68_03480 [Euryarchaeota archaeon]|nr:hypothetical protein [Euryarchaeota archaeon]
MASGVLRWAKILSGCSFLLLLIAVMSAGSALDDAEPYLDPAQFNEVFVEAGGSSTVDLSDDRYYLALRISEDGEDAPVDIRLVDSEGGDCPWEEPGALSIDRQTSPDSPIYQTVRLYLPGDSGTYTLHNDANEGGVWIVDDYAAQSEMLASPFVLLMMVGCCLGIPFGVVALVLAIVGWTKKGEPEVEAVAQTPIMTTEEIYREYNRVSSDDGEVPGPFMDSSRPVSEEPVEEPAEIEEAESYWKDWDNG